MDNISQGYIGWDPLGPCTNGICIFGQIVLAVIAVLFIAAYFFAPEALKSKIMFMGFWFFGHFMACLGVLAISYGTAEMEQVPWPTFAWLIVAFFVSFAHLAQGPKNDNVLFAITILPALPVVIYAGVVGVGEIIPFVIHWIILPACALIFCYILQKRTEGGKTEDSDSEGVREVSTTSPLDGFIGCGLVWAMVGPWFSLFAYSRSVDPDSLVHIMIILWMSFTLLLCLVIPIAVFFAYPKWRWYSVASLLFTIAGVVIFSVIFFVEPDAAVVLLLLNILLYIVLFAIRFVIPSGINKGGSINLTFHALHLHFFGIYSAICLAVWSLFVSGVVETGHSMVAWGFLFVWFSICCFALPFFHQMWANSQVRESQDGVWGETPGGEESGPSTREVLLGVWDKVLLCVPSLVFLIFFVAMFFVTIFDSKKGWAPGGYMAWFCLFTIPSVLYYGCSKISPRVFTIVKCGLFGVVGFVVCVLSLIFGGGALGIVIPWMVLSAVLMVLSCVISLGWGC